MKKTVLAVLGLVLSLWTFCGHGQSFGLSLAASPNPVIVSNSLAYTLTVTNNFGFIVPTATVTVTFSASVSIVSVSNPYGTYTTSANEIVLTIATLNPLLADSVVYTVEPLQAGILTNQVLLTSSSTTTTASATLTTAVTGLNGDLGISFIHAPSTAINYDLISYELSVTNLGANTVSGILLTNFIPPGLQLISLSPTNLSYTLETNSLIIQLGALVGGGVDVVALTAQPTNSGPIDLSAAVGSTGITDTNLANNVANAALTVTSPISNILSVSVISPQTYDPQTGLMEEVLQLTNDSTNTVHALRVNANNLTNLLYNAVGTNGVAPFVFYQGNINPGASVDLLIEYFNPSRTPGGEPIFEGFVVPEVPTPVPAGTGVNISSADALPNGHFLVEFPSVSGQTYRVLYSSTPDMANAIPVAPPVVATAGKTQWIDHGPPETVGPPSSVTERFYRIIQVP